MWTVKTWRWFEVRVHGLMTTDTPIARFFASDDPEPVEEPNG